MSKVVGLLFALNEREFIKEQLDQCMEICDKLVVRMGNMRITAWFSEGSVSTDGTKEFIEEYIKINKLEDRIVFDSGIYYENLFDSMKPTGFARAAEFCDKDDIIFEFCCNEFYILDEIRQAIDDIKTGKAQGNVFCVDFRHMYKLMRWSFLMGREHRLVKYIPGMYMDGQSKVMLNGTLVEPVNLPTLCYHGCPLKATSNIWKYINKYTGYSMRGKNGSEPTMEDIKWAINVLVDEGYLVPNEMIEIEMKKPPAYGIFCAKEYFGPWPEHLKKHSRWIKEVHDYYIKDNYNFDGLTFTK